MEYKGVPCIVPVAPFDASSDAQNLRAAMKGFGTNEKEIIDILTTRSNSQRQEILKEYNTQFERDMIDDLNGELAGNFEDVILALLTPPIEYLCEQLYEAMAGIGTDESTLVELLCPRSNEEMIELAAAYEAKYDRPLAEQMCSETSGYFRRLLTLIITGVRDAANTTDSQLAKEQAADLYAAGEEKYGTDEEIFNRIMAHASFAQLSLIFDEYKQLSGQTIEQAIKHELSDDLHDAMLAIVECVQSPAAFFANRLYKAMNGVGTDDRALIRIIVSRSEIDLFTIKEQFETIYNRTLYSAIEDSETSGDYKRTLTAIIGGA